MSSSQDIERARLGPTSSLRKCRAEVVQMLACVIDGKYGVCRVHAHYTSTVFNDGLKSFELIEATLSSGVHVPHFPLEVVPFLILGGSVLDRIEKDEPRFRFPSSPSALNNRANVIRRIKTARILSE